MSKRIDFVKSIVGLNDGEMKARIKEDQLRLKNWNLLILFLRWRTR